MSQTPDWLINGKKVDEVKFCREFAHKNDMVFAGNQFFSTYGIMTDKQVKDLIAITLMQYIPYNLSSLVQRLFDALTFCVSVDPIIPDPHEIHVLNGLLKTDGTFIPEMRICTNRLNVHYDPNNFNKKPEAFLAYLDKMLYPTDIDTLQEFSGYCFIPTTKGQSMMFIIGNGGGNSHVRGFKGLKV